MSTTEIRAELHELIDQIDDRLVKAIYSMVNAYQAEDIVGFKSDGSPVFSRGLAQELDDEVDQAKQGNFISTEELDKRSAKWLLNTK